MRRATAYFENDAADRSARLNGGDVGLETHALVGGEGFVPKTVVVVEAPLCWQSMHVVEVHFVSIFLSIIII